MSCSCDRCIGADYDVADDISVEVCDICKENIFAGQDYFKDEGGYIYCELCIYKHMHRVK